MNLCCNCIHQNVCEWDVSAYGVESEFGTRNCSAFRSENEAEFVIDHINADAFTFEQVYRSSNCGKV